MRNALAGLPAVDHYLDAEFARRASTMPAEAGAEFLRLIAAMKDHPDRETEARIDARLAALEREYPDPSGEP